MRKKGFTLVELLVVIAIIALLMGILMPALARVRQIAFRMVCGTNLSGIGKAMLIYSNDYDDELPRSGGRNSTWAGAIPQWMAANRFTAYGLSADGSGGMGSISSCFYLLVKYAEVTPKSFICKGDSGTTEFKPADEGAGDRELIDLWDFGPEPTKHCSYSYHLPFGLYALTTSSEPGMAVAADRNPFIASPAAEAKELGLFNPDGGREAVKAGNAITHQEDGQNVLFLDGHVGFEKVAFCGINDDNIYTFWDGGDIRRGGIPSLAALPGDRTDSLLVQEGEGMSSGGGTAPPKGRACFTSETTVWTSGQLVQIANVSGQSVEQVQEHTGTFVCRDIVLETGNKISVVDAHCFMTDSGQWVAAQNLTTSLRLKTLTGTVGIKSISTRSYTGKVYNVKVKSSDQYMVGKDAVVVLYY
jgi:prepilin-type N-terminal cleavage/methylation domain-containing protein/prepilin-type processing-associated H-X9-DG protein